MVLMLDSFANYAGIIVSGLSLTLLPVQNGLVILPHLILSNWTRTACVGTITPLKGIK